MKELIAYVDGSYCKKQKAYGSGIVLLHKDEVIKKVSLKDDTPELVEMWNVAGEIKAAEYAMLWAVKMGYSNLTICYDYEGIEKWCNGSWKAKKKATQDYAFMYGNISRKINIKFKKVKAHSGDLYNDLADRLAKDALGLR